MSKNVVIKVNGDAKLLKLGFNGFVELEEALGKPITEISNGEVAFADLRTIFMVALRRGGMKDITAEDAGDVLDDVVEAEGLQYLVDKLTELIQTSMGTHEQPDSFPTTKK